MSDDKKDKQLAVRFVAGKRMDAELIIGITALLFQSHLDELGDLLGYPPIGEVHLPGDWNNWGDSPEKAGHIRPKPETKMELSGDFYQLVVKGLSVGLHNFKPAIVINMPDKNGMAKARWLPYPGSTYDFLTEGKHQNWCLKVLPKKI